MAADPAGQVWVAGEEQGSVLRPFAARLVDPMDGGPVQLVDWVHDTTFQGSNSVVHGLAFDPAGLPVLIGQGGPGGEGWYEDFGGVAGLIPLGSASNQANPSGLAVDPTGTAYVVGTLDNNVGQGAPHYWILHPDGSITDAGLASSSNGLSAVTLTDGGAAAVGYAAGGSIDGLLLSDLGGANTPYTLDTGGTDYLYAVTYQPAFGYAACGKADGPTPTALMANFATPADFPGSLRELPVFGNSSRPDECRGIAFDAAGNLVTSTVVDVGVVGARIHIQVLSPLGPLVWDQEFLRYELGNNPPLVGQQLAIAGDGTIWVIDGEGLARLAP